MQPMQIAFFAACGLLLCGFVLLARLRLLQSLFVPASVIAGAIGFALIQGAGHTARWHDAARTLGDEYRTWPAWLISAVFAAMLLERPATPFRESLRRTASEGVIVWIIILGQLVVGLLVTWLVLGPLFHVPLPFGQLLEVSWAGGFGSAAAWGAMYEKLPGFPAARDLGVFFAATGLLYGVVSGLVLANVAIRRGWTHERSATNDAPGDDARDALLPSSGTPGEGQGGGSRGEDDGASGEHALRTTPTPTLPRRTGGGGREDTAPTPMAFARVRREMIDPLAFQGLILAAAFFVGVVLQWAVGAAAHAVGERFGGAAVLDHVGDLPLFLFTLIGGLLVREAMYATGTGHLIDPPSLHRITGVAMEFLIVSAIASMRLSSLVSFGLPALLLMAVGAVWTVFTLVWISPRLLAKRYWFELGIINYEMATATTAQGLMLLRIVDPELLSGAAEDYAMAAPLSAPFIGGGIVTLTLPLMFERVHVGWIIAAACAGLVLLYGVGRRLARPGGRAEMRGASVRRAVEPAQRD